MAAYNGPVPPTPTVDTPATDPKWSNYWSYRTAVYQMEYLDGQAACRDATEAMLQSLQPMLDTVVGRWSEHDAAVDRQTAALTKIAEALHAPAAPATPAGIPLETFTQILLAVIGAARPQA